MQKKKYFAIVRGKRTGVFYGTWDQYKDCVLAVPGAVYKGFQRKEDAEAFLAAHQDAVFSGQEPAPAAQPVRSKAAKRPLGESAESKRQKRCASPALSEGDSALHIYTDGSCLDNGTSKARAGFGVYFGHDDARNVSLPLSGTVQTNNRAEMTAVIAALEASASHPGRTIIYSDSQYVKNGIMLWLPAWKKKAWKRADGKPVLNQDLWQRLDGLVASRADRIRFHWVKGHSGDVGNEQADALANLGARMVSKASDGLESAVSRLFQTAMAIAKKPFRNYSQDAMMEIRQRQEWVRKKQQQARPRSVQLPSLFPLVETVYLWKQDLKTGVRKWGKKTSGAFAAMLRSGTTYESLN
ncbi:hypothetical protein HDV03_000432 [Kappamyces sp. JEL0829]|nr:hypothetical protein HDV03_000432 [Kappamyces sp. JEL0829]